MVTFGVVVTATGVVLELFSQSAQLEALAGAGLLSPRFTAAPNAEPARPNRTNDPFMLIEGGTGQHTRLGRKRRKYDRALAKEPYAKRRSDPKMVGRVCGWEEQTWDRKMLQGFCTAK